MSRRVGKDTGTAQLTFITDRQGLESTERAYGVTWYALREQLFRSGSNCLYEKFHGSKDFCSGALQDGLVCGLRQYLSNWPRVT